MQFARKALDAEVFDNLQNSWLDVATLLRIDWPGCGSADMPVCPVGFRRRRLYFEGAGAHYQLDTVSTFDVR